MEIGSDRSLFILQGDRPFYSIKVDRPFDTKKSVSEALEEDRPSLRKSCKGRSTFRCQKERSPAVRKKGVKGDRLFHIALVLP